MANGESSKKGKKKGKMEQASIQAALAEEDQANRGVLIGEPIDERATVSTQSSRNEEKGKGKQKTGRGLAKLKLKETNKTFEVNEFCEPVGSNSSEYCGDLGTLVREHVPSSIKSWKHVPQKIKEDMWDILKRKWKLSEADKKIALQRMGKIRRDSKSKVSKKIRDFEASDNESGGEHDINDLRPAWMDDEDWAKFLEQRQSDEFKDESLKFQEIRKKQTFVHRSSRKEFARLVYDLKKNTDDLSKITRIDVWTKGYTKDGKSDNPEIQRVIEQMDSFSNTHEGQSQSSVNNDALAHVFGTERPGRVRGLGFGATPSKVHASIGDNRHNTAMADELAEMREKLNQQTAEINSTKFFMSQQMAEMNQMKEMISTLLSQRNQSQGAFQSSQHVPPTGNLNNRKCTLLNWMIDGEVPIGEGTILSTDPTNECHFVPLGSGCYKVWVTQVFESIGLFRPNSEAQFLGQAIGVPVAWPIKSLRIHM